MQPVTRFPLQQQRFGQPQSLPSQHQITVQNPSSKLIEHQNNMTAIKKISNFSYALSDKIGLGLTSHVYRGKDDRTGQRVAIKVINLKENDGQLNQELLNEEIITLEKIKNLPTNHLLELEGVIRTSNHLYIITEFCQGKDMMKTLKQKGTISQGQAQTAMRQMILGYKELYGIGIIHRDLKLSNLFISNGKIKLADFGFAIREDKCNLSFKYNVGSPKYMSPQCLKYNKYSFKSDAWAMGVIAYELVYGYAPWKNKVQSKLYDQIVSTPIENLFDPNIPVSNHYKNFIVNCLRVDPSQRADANFIFSYQWPLDQYYVQGFKEEEKKAPEVIKVPGNNYAVYRTSSKDISYQSKKLDAEDFTKNTRSPSQMAIVSQLQYCQFLVNLYSHIKSLNNPLFKTLKQEVALTAQIKMKVLGSMAVVQKNKFMTEDFDEYVKSIDWQNLKQVLIRYDIQFREEMQGEPPVRKNAVIPQSSILPQTISAMKYKLPENAHLLDKLLTYLEIRGVDCNASPLQFAQKVNINAAVKDAENNKKNMSQQNMSNRVSQRLAAMGF